MRGDEGGSFESKDGPVDELASAIEHVPYLHSADEAEEAVKETGPSVVSIFRPALIIGARHTPWLLEKVLPVFSFVPPAKYRSITVQQIAKAMIATSLKTPAKSAVYHYLEMVALKR